MAVPKRKTSRWRRDQRRASSFFNLKGAALTKCPNCGELALPHRVCPYCGYYRGRQVIEKS
ncbi:MAG: 50S ribosomal protein L32 [Aquificaceae bacterium]